MKIFALGDLHLSLKCEISLDNIKSFQGYKPMDIFGENWTNHSYRIYEHWQDTVGENDVVLIPGDISWAMTLADVVWDFDFIGKLKGRKILLRGNHDYWWHSASKIRSMLPPSMEILQNDAKLFNNVAIAGTRLWTLPSSSDFTPSDRKIYDRELIRLGLSLEDASHLPTIVMFHYMPFNEKAEENEVSNLLQRYPVETVIYGHLHDKSHYIAVEGQHFGMDFHLVSADYLEFVPKLIREI